MKLPGQVGPEGGRSALDGGDAEQLLTEQQERPGGDDALDHGALGVEVALVDLEERHALGLEPQHHVEVVAGHGLEVLGDVGGGERIERAAGALHVLEVMNFSKEERDAYEDRLKWFRIEANTLKKMRDDSLKEGIEIGKTQGIEEGKIEGKIEVARNLKKAGLSLEMIAKATGMSSSELKDL